MKYAWIDTHAQSFALNEMYTILDVSISGYRAWKSGGTLDHRKGNCWDNVPTESWFNSFMNKRYHGLRYATHAEIKAASFEYIDVFYNRKRPFNASLQITNSVYGTLDE